MVDTTRFGPLWQLSGRVYPGRAPRTLLNRLRYVRHAKTVAPLVQSLLDAPSASLLGRHVAARAPMVLGFVDAPYVNARWSREERLAAFIRQARIVGDMGPAFDFALNESIELPLIEALGPDYLLVIDKPAWCQREGLLAISVFRGNLRLFSVAFSFDEIDGRRTLVIGGVQGRRIDGALEEYRKLTELAHGLHPRKLLIEVLRMIAAAVGVEHVVAIADAARHHRHPFFGSKMERTLPLDYDEIWRDRGGEETGDGSFFALPLHRLVRELDDLEEISPKKRKKRRAQYRKRYPMLDAIEADIHAAMPALRPVVRPEAD